MLNIYSPDITHLPLLLIKIYRYSNAKPVSLCLGNYSDISSHTRSMTCIGNNFLNKHIQSKFGKKRSGFFWAKHRNCCLPCVSPKVKGTWPLQMTSFQKRSRALPSSLDPHRSSSQAQTSPGVSTAAPRPPIVLWKGTEKVVRWVQLHFPQKFQQGTEKWKLWSLPKDWQLGVCFSSSHVVTRVPSPVIWNMFLITSGWAWFFGLLWTLH